MRKNEDLCVVCGRAVSEGRQVCGMCNSKRNCKYFRNEKACFILTELVCKERSCSFYQEKGESF